MSDSMYFFRQLMSTLWRFFTLKVPGFDFTFAALGFFLALIPIVIGFVSRLLGNGNFADTSRITAMGVGKLNSMKRSRANSITNHANNVERTLGGN